MTYLAKTVAGCLLQLCRESTVREKALGQEDQGRGCCRIQARCNDGLEQCVHRW